MNETKIPNLITFKNNKTTMPNKPTISLLYSLFNITINRDYRMCYL